MLRIGLVGAGANTRLRHIPGLLSQGEISLAAVCNRRPESSRAVAAEFSIPHVFDRWQDLVASPEVDAVVIGTWPYLHAPITLAALAAGKHVLTEARMAMNATEAHAMLAASQANPSLICQIVPSPFGLAGGEFVQHLLAGGYLGELREVSVVHRTAALADPGAPLHWRQDKSLSGVNMLTVGILHETLSRWLPQPARLIAQAHAFVPSRLDPASGMRRAVGTPDSVQIAAQLPTGAQINYQFSGATPFGQQAFIRLHGTEGALEYDLLHDSLRGASSHRSQSSGAKLEELAIPDELRGKWQVEEDFVRSIREGAPVTLTSFKAGVAYMEFTEAVARSAATGTAVTLG